jgi:hypothetical protein
MTSTLNHPSEHPNIPATLLETFDPSIIAFKARNDLHALAKLEDFGKSLTRYAVRFRELQNADNDDAAMVKTESQSPEVKSDVEGAKARDSVTKTDIDSEPAANTGIAVTVTSEVKRPHSHSLLDSRQLLAVIHPQGSLDGQESSSDAEGMEWSEPHHQKRQKVLTIPIQMEEGQGQDVVSGQTSVLAETRAVSRGKDSRKIAQGDTAVSSIIAKSHFTGSPKLTLRGSKMTGKCVIIIVPPGKLGVEITKSRQGIVVSEVDHRSRVKGVLYPGDRLGKLMAKLCCYCLNDSPLSYFPSPMLRDTQLQSTRKMCKGSLWMEYKTSCCRSTVLNASLRLCDELCVKCNTKVSDAKI